MINKVISSVCTALYNAFGDEYHIYKEVVNQNLKQPCFFVNCIVPKRTKVLGDRYYRQNAICIHYFPSSDETYRIECNNILEKIYITLEYLTIDSDLIMGKNLNVEYSDGVMLLFIDFDFYTYEQVNALNVMEELVYKG